MTDTFDWAGLWSEAADIRYEHGDSGAAAFLRTRIEAAFVPVDHYAAVISDHDELLQCEIARAEAAEAECLEQARLVGMSGERELALRAELEALTAQLAEARESERAAVVAWLKSMVTGYPESSAYAHAAFLIEAGEHLK